MQVTLGGVSVLPCGVNWALILMQGDGICTVFVTEGKCLFVSSGRTILLTPFTVAYMSLALAAELESGGTVPLCPP